MAVRMKQDGVYEDELRQLAASINFEVKNDDDLLRLFKEAKKLDFWPDLDEPKPNVKTGFFVPKTSEPKELFRTKPNWACLTGVPEKADVQMMKDGKIKVTFPSEKQEEEKQKERLRLELERLTQLGDALEKNNNEDLDEWLNKI